MATTTKTLLTAEEFMEQYADRGPYELVRGEPIALSPGKFDHSFICAKIARILEEYGERTGLGYALGNDFAVITERGPDTVRGADVAFYREDRLPRKRTGQEIPSVVPDLVVEVFSPGNRRLEMLGKVQEYLNAGVSCVWVVHPTSRQIAIYRPGGPIAVNYGEQDLLTDLPELPGFSCPVAAFFPS